MATGHTAAIRKAAMSKQQATCANKLVPRLARYLGNDTHYGKQQVRKMLMDGGYAGPGWDDEERAVRILTEAGKDMTKFERAATFESVLKEAAFVTAADMFSPRSTVAPVPAPDTAAAKLKTVKIILMQGENAILKEIKEGKRRNLGGTATVIGAALDEIGR